MQKKEYNSLPDSEKAKEDWMNSKWRPMMGWAYMLTCIADFVIFPILWSILQALSKGQVNMQWQPITLQGAGLFHMSMGVIIGVSAYGRTQEKLNGANNGGLQLPTAVGSTYTPPPPIGQPAAGNFSSPSSTPVGQYSGATQSAISNGPESSSFGSKPMAPAGWGLAPVSQTFTSKSGKIGPVLDEPEI